MRPKDATMRKVLAFESTGNDHDGWRRIACEWSCAFLDCIRLVLGDARQLGGPFVSGLANATVRQPHCLGFRLTSLEAVWRHTAGDSIMKSSEERAAPYQIPGRPPSDILKYVYIPHFIMYIEHFDSGFQNMSSVCVWLPSAMPSTHQ